MGRAGRYIGGKLKESFRNHPRRWVVAGAVGAVIAGGAGHDLEAGNLDKWLDKNPAAAADANSTTETSAHKSDKTHTDAKGMTERQQKREAAKKAVATLSCKTIVTNDGKPVLHVKVTKGRIPSAASVGYVAHYIGDSDHSRYGGGDPGKTDVDMSSRHGTVVDSAQATVSVYGEEKACKAWPDIAAMTGDDAGNQSAEGATIAADSLDGATGLVPATAQPVA